AARGRLRWPRSRAPAPPPLHRSKTTPPPSRGTSGSSRIRWRERSACFLCALWPARRRPSGPTSRRRARRGRAAPSSRAQRGISGCAWGALLRNALALDDVVRAIRRQPFERLALAVRPCHGHVGLLVRAEADV